VVIQVLRADIHLTKWADFLPLPRQWVVILVVQWVVHQWVVVVFLLLPRQWVVILVVQWVVRWVVILLVVQWVVNKWEVNKWEVILVSSNLGRDLSTITEELMTEGNPTYLPLE